MLAGMKETHKVSCGGLECGDVGAFVAVAVRTTQSKVTFVIRAAMLFGNNMVELVSREVCALWKEAVFAAFFGALENKSP